ncbi:dihydrofolate reductase family protein [Demequina lignilytica]|uniref:Dihydrofolate reductase family protein n=1 Tax=Demequina lignilytica TaxID=3051663 RepID=A0AB35MJ02_9MICO|nr:MULTISPECIES: dihydrofolate reductase family protein [unclassified Demequina]MDN4483809.1 dihydrofolate reductase family protein [Demequina sp. SYSU T0a273]MDN4491635.1 dihydrofolate reductase family protein [Demequina sp. SYSU T00068]
MARLVYATICSLDGYVNDAQGEFDWAQPDEQLHDHFTDLARTIGTYLYGRRMHETMVVWEDLYGTPVLPPHLRTFAEAWVASDKVVYSGTLDEPGIPRARIEREFDADDVRHLKDRADRDLGIGGPTLAAHALTAGLVDEIQLAVVPAIVGAGTRALPDGLRLDLELLEHRTFPQGSVLLRYAVR